MTTHGHTCERSGSNAQISYLTGERILQNDRSLAAKRNRCLLMDRSAYQRDLLPEGRAHLLPEEDSDK